MAEHPKVRLFVADPWLAFALVKRLRLDFLAQKACELGVARLVPVITRRTAVGRLNAERLRARARAIALGPRILRAETAALAVLALWQSAAADWRD